MPQLPLLNEDKHLGHPDNVAKIMELVDTLKGYSMELENSLDCHQTQSKKE